MHISNILFVFQLHQPVSLSSQKPILPSHQNQLNIQKHTQLIKFQQQLINIYNKIPSALQQNKHTFCSHCIIYSYIYITLYHKLNIKVQIQIKRESIMILSIFLALLLFVFQSMCAWTQLSNEVLKMPAYVYTVACVSGEFVSGVIKWNGTADLDLFVYREGNNLLSRSVVYKKFLSYSQDSRQWFSFNCPSTANLNYRVQAYSIPYSLSFSMQITMPSSPSTLIYNGYFINFSPRMQAIKLTNALQNRPTAVRVSIIGSSSITPFLTSTSSSSTYNISSPTFICLPSIFSNGQWNVYFYHSTSLPITTITSYTQILQVDYLTTDCVNFCEANQVWDNSTNSCISPVDPNNNGNQDIASNADKSGVLNGSVIIGVGIGGFGAFLLIALIVFLCKKCQSQAKVVIPEIIVQQNSETYLDIKSVQDSCSICLQGRCDSFLLCHHFFHRQCIEQWYRRNKNCPMCRSQIKIKKLKSVSSSA